jgi:hypothetical protein
LREVKTKGVIKMKMEITYTCGHKGVINVTGDAKNRERQQ